MSRVRSVLCALLLVTFGAGAGVAAAGSINLTADAGGFAIGIPTSDPAVYTVTIIASGQSTPLGDFRASTHHFTDITTGAFSQGTLTIDFVGGDKLFGTYVGAESPTASPDIFTAVGTVTFTGGAGRLAGASGRGTFQGELRILSISPGGIVREAVTLHLDARVKF